MGTLRNLKIVATCCAPILLTANVAAAQPAATLPQQTPPARAGFEKMLESAGNREKTAQASPDIKGTGPYPAQMEMDLALPGYTIYRPANLSLLGKKKLGVLIWGNGGCSDDGASAYKHLAEIASHGYLVIAPGKPLTGPLVMAGGPAPAMMRTTMRDLREGLDWALAENKRQGSPYFQRLSPALVAASGHSCGGMQAVMLADDARVKALIVHNSGIVPILPDNPPLIMHSERGAGIKSPTLFLLGGESDVIWKFGVATFEQIAGPPVMLASRETGHGGTFGETNGGDFSQVAVDWLEWRLRGSTSAAVRFAGPNCTLCQDKAWTVRKKNMR